MKISDHISYTEAVKTSSKLSNEPNEAQKTAMVWVAEYLFEPVRKWWDKPINVNSFFRSKEVNREKGGASSSQHVKGEAIDFSAQDKKDNAKLFKWIYDNLDFDQLIWEAGNDDYPDWIHGSLKPTGNRKDCLRMTRINGKSVYTKYVPK